MPDCHCDVHATLAWTIGVRADHQWLTWYADESVDGATEAVQRSPERVVIGPDFEFRFRAPRPVKVKVIAEGQHTPALKRSKKRQNSQHLAIGA